MPYVLVNGINVSYQIYGEGQPLLFIHGLGSCGKDWEQQISTFSEKYQVIVYDVRGSGESDKPSGPYSIQLFARDCAELLQVLGMDQVNVVGISMGAMIALQIAIDYPQLVKSLVVVNTGAELMVRNFKDLYLLWQRILIIRILGMRRLGKVLSKRLFPKPEQATLRELFVERCSQNEPYAYRETLKSLVGWSVVDGLDQIVCPTLIVAAEHDYTPLNEKEVFLAKIPEVHLEVMEDSHHAAPMEKPEEFNRLLDKFLSVHN